MKLELTAAKRESLEAQHKKERDKRVADRIKAVLLNAEGWTQIQIASVEYGLSAMTKWLNAHKFSYKQLKGVPSKADPEKQAAFIAYYEALKKNTPKNEPIEFADGVHPTMATKITSGWIRTGVEKTIETTASRTRRNLFGSINLATLKLTITQDKTIKQHFQSLKKKYPEAPKIHIILDNGPYNTSIEVKEEAKTLGIELHYLPTYSPNLNAIEQLWKVMNEEVRNNRFFSSAKEFRMSILDFFEKTWPIIAPQKVDRVNDCFRVFGK